MLKKITTTILLVFIVLFSFTESTILAEEIALEKLLSNVTQAINSINDFSCKFVTITGENSFLTQMEGMLGQSLPKKTEIMVWIKNPFMMKTEQPPGITSIVRKEGEDLLQEAWVQEANTLSKNKLPVRAWPAWPSLESILVIIDRFKDQSTPYTIEKKEDSQEGITYILTFKSVDSGREDAYYVRESDWLIYKSVLYENGKMSIISEWHNIAVNTNLSDDVFKLKIPDDAKIVTRDLSVPQTKGQPNP